MRASKGKTRVHRNINKYNREYNNVQCSKYPSHVFEANLSTIYEQIVYWRKNLFLLPSRKAGKQYIDETTKLMNEWLIESPLKDIAFKATLIMPNLLLQKLSKNSKAKDHLKALERHLESWISGDLPELLKEAETIQKSLRSKKTSTNIAEISKRFSQEMKKGNVNSTMEILTGNMKNGILPLKRQTLTHFSPMSVKPTIVKTHRRERSISRNIANRYTRKNPSY